MTRAAPLLLALSLVAACGSGVPIPDDHPGLRIATEVSEVKLGRGFPLLVTRVWPKGGEAPAFSEEALAPLTVRLVESSRREDGGRVAETRRYLGYAFSLGTVVVPVPEGEPLRIRVRRALDPSAPGPAELAGGPLTKPRFPLLPALLLAVAAAAGATLFLRHRRRSPVVVREPPAPAAAPAPAPSPDERALSRIARLRGREPRNREEIRSFCGEAAGIARDYAGERFSVRLVPMTTEECLLALGADEDRDLLSVVLGPADLVKFACHEPDRPERTALLDAAERFVRETTP